MANQRVKFATQIDESVLRDIKTLAKKEGRHIQAIIEEALVDLLTARRVGKISPDVLQAMEACNEEYGDLLRELAK